MISTCCCRENVQLEIGSYLRMRESNANLGYHIRQFFNILGAMKEKQEPGREYHHHLSKNNMGCPRGRRLFTEEGGGKKRWVGWVLTTEGFSSIGRSRGYKIATISTEGGWKVARKSQLLDEGKFK